MRFALGEVQCVTVGCVLYSKFSLTCVIRRELRLGLGLVYTPRDAP